MNVQTLIETLQRIKNPEARVKLSAVSPKEGSTEAHGDVLLIVVAEVDGTDKLVTLSNCVKDQRGNVVFDVKPQFMRLRMNTSDGIAAAVADLHEQAGCTATQDLATMLEVERMKDVFRKLDG